MLQVIPVARKRNKRKTQSIEVIVKVKNAWKACPSEFGFIDRTSGPNFLDEKMDALVDGRIGKNSGIKKRVQRPGGLGGRARALALEMWIGIGGAGLAPTPVGILVLS